jgi:predicted phosphodiesterase
LALRIGLISDIHGNYVSLDVVLKELERIGIDKIVCLGDVIQGGPEPIKVLQKLKELDLEVIFGNADEEVLEANMPRSSQDEFEKILRDIDRWTLSQLSTSDIDYIRSFKPSIQIPLTERESTLSCFHGSPRSNREGIFPTLNEEKLAEILSKIEKGVIACGHTHSQMFRRFLGSIIVNPGSVGLPFEFETVGMFLKKDAYNPCFAEYAILNCSYEGAFHVELCRAPVSREKIVSSFIQSGMPHAGFISKDWRTI